MPWPSTTVDVPTGICDDNEPPDPSGKPNKLIAEATGVASNKIHVVQMSAVSGGHVFFTLTAYAVYTYEAVRLTTQERNSYNT